MNKARNNKPKIPESSEEESESSSPPQTKPSKQQQLHTKKTTKNKDKVQSDQEHSILIVENQLKKPLKTQNTVNKKTTKPLRKTKRGQSSDQPSDSSEEKPQKKIVKTKFPLQIALNRKKPIKKQTSQDQQSEQQQPNKVVKPTAVKAAVAQKKTKKVSSQSEQSSEEQVPKKSTKIIPVSKVKSPVQKVLVANKKKQSSEQEQQEQQEQEVKPKQLNKVIVKTAEKKQVEPLASIKPVVEQKIDEQIDEQGQFQVCVKGLSFYADENDLQQLFKPIGNLLNVKLLTKEDGKSKGLAFVKFSSKNSYNKALELNGTQHLGRDITIEPSLSKQKQNNNAPKNNHQSAPIQITSPTLFLGGLSFNSTNQSISALFSSAGEVVSIRIVTDKQTGKSKGFGYVQFRDVETAKKAYQTLNNTVLDGRQLRIDNATQKDKPQRSKKGDQIVKVAHQKNLINKGSLATFRGSLVPL